MKRVPLAKNKVSELINIQRHNKTQRKSSLNIIFFLVNCLMTCNRWETKLSNDKKGAAKELRNNKTPVLHEHQTCATHTITQGNPVRYTVEPWPTENQKWDTAIRDFRWKTVKFPSVSMSMYCMSTVAIEHEEKLRSEIETNIPKI